jgi:hypothetical protein
MDDVAARLVQNLFGRIDGPLAMRLIIQPVMAAVFATRDGIKDARQGRLPYGWLLLTDAKQRRQHLKEGWGSIRKVFFAALAVDIAYQAIELRWIYPGEALIMAEALALAPYAVLRGLSTRIADRHRHRVAARR